MEKFFRYLYKWFQGNLSAGMIIGLVLAYFFYYKVYHHPVKDYDNAPATGVVAKPPTGTTEGTPLQWEGTDAQVAQQQQNGGPELLVYDTSLNQQPATDLDEEALEDYFDHILPPSPYAYDSALRKADSAALVNYKATIVNAAREETRFPYLFLVLAAMLFVASLNDFIRNQHFFGESVLDRDPEELDELFHTYARAVIQVGTPRRMKRFSNKIRFEYNVLRNGNKLGTARQRRLFMEMMLTIEANPHLCTIKDPDGFAQQLKEAHEVLDQKVEEPFTTWQLSNPTDMAMVQNAYHMNQNMLR